RRSVIRKETARRRPMSPAIGSSVHDVSSTLETVALPPLQLPGDLSRGPQVGFRPGVHACQLPAALVHDLAEPPEDFQPRFLAALQALLHRYTQQREIPVRLTIQGGPDGSSWLLGDVQAEDCVTDLLDRARHEGRLVRSTGPTDGGVAITFCVVSAPSPSGVPHGSGGLWPDRN